MFLKLILTIFCWLAVLPIIYGFSFEPIYNFIIIGVYLSLLFVMFILSRLTTKLMVCVLFLGTYLILSELPNQESLLKAGNFFIIFAAFLPSLWLLRSTAMTMPSVKKTQKLLSDLVSTKVLSGIQVTSHILGGVLNIGTFPLLSSVIPKILLIK